MRMSSNVVYCVLLLVLLTRNIYTHIHTHKGAKGMPRKFITNLRFPSFYHVKHEMLLLAYASNQQR